MNVSQQNESIFMRKIRNAASEQIFLGVISRKRNHCKIRDGHSPRRQLETPRPSLRGGMKRRTSVSLLLELRAFAVPGKGGCKRVAHTRIWDQGPMAVVFLKCLRHVRVDQT